MPELIIRVRGKQFVEFFERGRYDVRQPNSGRLTPTESLLQSMPRKMLIQELRQTHLLHQGQEYHKSIDALCLNVHIFFHTSQYAREFTFCLPPLHSFWYTPKYIRFSIKRGLHRKSLNVLFSCLTNTHTVIVNIAYSGKPVIQKVIDAKKDGTTPVFVIQKRCEARSFGHRRRKSKYTVAV